MKWLSFPSTELYPASDSSSLGVRLRKTSYQPRTRLNFRYSIDLTNWSATNVQTTIAREETSATEASACALKARPSFRGAGFYTPKLRSTMRGKSRSRANPRVRGSEWLLPDWLSGSTTLASEI